MRIPRILIAAPKSGSGKTLITCALLGALKQKQKNVISFKCGPDYIDPMFHRTVLDVPSENLDTWFSGEEGTRRQFLRAANGFEIAVMEGVMGLFDGLGGVYEVGSSYHLASVTKTPILLLADVHGMGRSMIPMLKGFLEYDTAHLIRGILLNRITPGFFETMRPHLEAELGIPAVGFFPPRKDIRIESRHLGLQLPMEIADLRKQLQSAARQMEETGGLDRILRIAKEAEPLTEERTSYEAEGHRASGHCIPGAAAVLPAKKQPVLAVARDEAFCFYYKANLRLLEEQGIVIRTFSPLHDSTIPEDADGLLLGGGYPELYAAELSRNASMRESVCRAIRSGMPSLAECGGFLYLHQSLTDPEGKAWNMAGVLPAEAHHTGKAVRFGYVEIREKNACFLPAGGKIRGHEFHYYDSSDNGADCVAEKPVGGRAWDCIHEEEDHFWGFAHLYYPSAPEFPAYFAEKMRAYQSRKDSRQEA